MVVVATVALTIATGGVASTLLVGAGIGAGVSLVTSTVSQLSTGTFSFGQLILDISFGAITGLIGGSALGTIGSALAMGFTGFASSITSDLVTTGTVDYGKATINGLFGAVLGAKSGAQYGLTGQTKNLQNSLKAINNKIASGGYSLRGGKGALNLIGYQLNKATNILKLQSITNLIFDNLTSNIASEEIFKYFINSLF